MIDSSIGIICGGVLVAHNTTKWRSCTNRHTTTCGRSWGWIEGAPGNVCWSNESGSNFTGAQAAAAVHEHNVWLENQRPISLRIVEAIEAVKRAESDAKAAKTAMDNADRKLCEAVSKLAALKTQEEQEPTP